MTIKNSKLARRIAERLIAAGFPWPGGVDNAMIRRTRAGHWQRSSGAVSWTLEQIELVGFQRTVGSHEPASVVAAAPFLEVHYETGNDMIFMDPCEEDPNVPKSERPRSRDDVPARPARQEPDVPKPPEDVRGRDGGPRRPRRRG